MGGADSNVSMAIAQPPMVIGDSETSRGKTPQPETILALAGRKEGRTIQRQIRGRIEGEREGEKCFIGQRESGRYRAACTLVPMKMSHEEGLSVLAGGKGRGRVRKSMEIYT
jgi:hypothetical protein